MDDNEILSELKALRALMATPRGVSMSVVAAGERLGCGRSRVFELLKEGRLRRVKNLGRKTLVMTESVEALEMSLMPAARPKREGRALPKKYDPQADLLDFELGMKRLLGAP